ncbi:uncharacterized protein N7459_002095 [Penicillium hispanicum]|uniref:uncharacterized protein n=1 Tax=Penicillium hispanicum TaxID=1080232 RepID=UPI0025421711|nr:uncharacterized protein N7459_002095 [Penicillium hispanicum]KAJ5591726.1 hypothetical protein N7459_002095 [Penicillium hispanicum]
MNMITPSWPTDTKIRLPYPYLTTLHLVPGIDDNGREVFHLRKGAQPTGASTLPREVYYDRLSFTRPQLSTATAASSTQRGFRPSPMSVCTWNSMGVVTINHIWLIIYAIFTVEPNLEIIRLQLKGHGSDAIAEELQRSMLGLRTKDELMVFRSAFWQGCASPLGSRPIWTPSSSTAVPHLHHVTTSTATTFCTHPLRPPKPTPGSVAYSRYIPQLDKTFFLVTIDHRNPLHAELLHQWQTNSAMNGQMGATGDSHEHPEHLRKDPTTHKLGLLGEFDATPFGYFEVSWAKEDVLGAPCSAGDFDRGFQVLIGDSFFTKGSWMQAWWLSLLHYMFLDEHRTESVFGELPGDEPLGDASPELFEDLVVNLPHRRINLVKCLREQFFQFCSFDRHSTTVALKSQARL